VILSLVALVLLDMAADRLLVHRRIQVRDLYVVVPDAGQMRAVQGHLYSHGLAIRRLDMVELGELIGVDLVVSGPEDAIERAVGTVHDIDGVRFASNELGEEGRGI
jgi:hypothetical protein